MYNAIVTKLTNVRSHSNADRVQLATCQGNQVVVGLDCREGDLGVYFPCDGVLSHEFCFENNLYRDKLLNKDTKSSGMFDTNRRVRAQRFRGEISDGFWVPMSYFKFLKITSLDENFEFQELNKVSICNKWINQATLRAARENQGKKTKAAKTSIMFKEHFDTGQFGKSIHEFGHGQLIIITEKLHGTSGRIGHVKVDRKLSFIEKIAKKLRVKVQEYEWKYLNGTRRVVLEESSGTQFHDPTIRDKAFNIFNNNLRKGETVYFEIVGFESTGAAIMPAPDTRKLDDKAFTKKYGEIMPYSYGCKEKESDIFVYRMTLANEDGQTIDYSWNDVVKRCNEINVKTVPHIRTLTFEELEHEYMLSFATDDIDDRAVQNYFSDYVNSLCNGPSILDTNHIKEGVCVRIEGGLSNKTFKQKSFEFKFLEGMIKDSGVVDTEEAQDAV